MSFVLPGLAVLTSLVLAFATTSEPPAAEGNVPEEQAGTVVAIALTDAKGDVTPAATEGLGDGASAVALAGLSTTDEQPDRDDPRAAAPGDADLAVLTPAMATPEFFVAGLSWSGDAALEPGQALIRVQEGDGWSEWMELEPGQDGPDELPEGAVAGTDPVISGGGVGVQVAVRDEGALPANLQLSLVPAEPGNDRSVVTDALPETTLPPEAPLPEASDGEQSPSVQPAVAAAGTALERRAASPAVAAAALAVAPSNAVVVDAPTVITREGWEVDESLPAYAGTDDWAVRYAHLHAAVVHHTAGSNTYSEASAPSIVRGIYYYHAVTRGWGDIGYNFLVDRFGNIYEGRKGTLESEPGEMAIAGHARGYNTSSLGISVMGNFETVSPPEISLTRIVDVIAWHFARSGVDMTKPSGMISPGTATRPAGENLPRIFGHKDVANTTCPARIYARIPELAERTRSRLPQLFYLNNAFSSAADVSFYYGPRQGQVHVGDWDGDDTDTVGVRTGNILRATNENEYGPADLVVGYGRADDVVIVGDWDGDGDDTLAIRRGSTYYISNGLAAGPAEHVITYGRPDDEVLVGDWDGDGDDTLAIRRGRTYYVRNSLSTGPAEHVSTYGRPDDDALVGDWDGDRDDTLAIRRGTTYLIRNSLTTGAADLTVTYGAPADLVVVGDWDGDGRVTLGTRRLQ
jgi:hypothetical protein